MSIVNVGVRLAGLQVGYAAKVAQAEPWLSHRSTKTTAIIQSREKAYLSATIDAHVGNIASVSYISFPKSHTEMYVRRPAAGS